MIESSSDAVVESLLSAEHELQAAILASDVEALDRLLDDGVLYTGASGEVVEKAADLEAHRSGALDVTSIDNVELTARVIGDTGITFLHAVLSGTGGGQAFQADMRYTRTWSRSSGRWVVVAAHASVVV